MPNYFLFEVVIMIVRNYQMSFKVLVNRTQQDDIKSLVFTFS